ncbi:MAG: BBP7 family outer membrane beta-barrel protein, partial [Planctomycetota bacterium]
VIYRPPSTEIAITALEQVEGFAFVDSLNENLAYSGIQFVEVQTNGTDSFGDDTVLRQFDTSGFTTVAELEAGIIAFNSDATNQANNQEVRVGGAPQPYQVRNGIRDALGDPGLAWGERYEFGYSDGERGWMISILDGPEARSGGVYGAGEASPYTSQSGTDIYGPDPFFLSDLQDDDGDGQGDGDGELGAVDLFALGFGSVAVNFNLPNPDFLTGFRDYFDNSTNGSAGTQTGPILYVGNYGTEETDFDLVNTDVIGGTGQINLNANDSIAELNLFNTEQMLADPNEVLLGQQIAAVIDDLNANLQILVNSDDIEDDAPIVLQAQAAVVQAAALQSALQTSIFNDPQDMVTQNEFTAQVNALFNTLTALNQGLAAVVIVTDGDVDGQELDVETERRLADDLDGNGSAGVVRVLADINGDGTIDPGEIIAIINNFADLHEFNVFFDEVTIRNTTEIDGVELMRTHQLSTRHKLEQGRWDDLRLSYGVRFMSLDDEFFFQGLGSILGRTTVETNIENQIVGPQLGLQWIRRDGPWDFVVEGRGTLGYNIVDVDQYGIFGEEAIPGALNRSATARTTTSVDGASFNEFSPLGELRAQLRYRLAEAVTLQAGYTAKYVGKIHRGGISTAWNAPDFGIDDSTSDIFINGFNIGVELRH